MAAPMKILRLSKIEPISNEEQELPYPRSGHRIVADNSNFYSIGGYNPEFWEMENDEDTSYPLFKELWKFNFASRKWMKLKTEGPMPEELASHSAVLLGHHLVVFGGTGIPFGEAASNKVYVCNLQTLQWNYVQCVGDAPIKGYGHSLVVVQQDLYIFGGTTGWEYNGNLHKLNLRSKSWNHLEPADGNTPDGRYRHEVACDGKKLYVFGGGRANKVFPFKQVPVYDIERNLWENCESRPDGDNDVPQDRRCHACVQYQNCAYISGGYNGTEIFSDIWKIHLPSLKWTKLAIQMPLPAYFHSAAVTPNGAMYLFGGVTHIDDARTSEIYSMWLTVPSLRDLCWEVMTEMVQDIDLMPKNSLLKAGIPADLVHRIQS